MKFKFVSFIVATYAVIGFCIVAFSQQEVKGTLNYISYLLLYIIVPLYGACGVWKQSLLSVIVCLIFFTSQSIRFIGGETWFPYPPPFSLAIPFGNFAGGQGYLFDYFAASMVVFLAILVRLIFNFNNNTNKHK